jgi:hypothetical protein
VAAFLLAVASYYRPPYGFTELIRLPVDNHDEYELASIRAVPHVEDLEGGYDGQFYARLAVEPLLRDPAIDRTMDFPAYRARRILFSWTAYVMGFGRPAWILEAFALQNAIAWLVLAWLLLRWFPIGSARAFFLWSGCLLTHGMLSSVGNALLDAPSALLLAWAVRAAERGRLGLTSLVLGAAGLGRETNLIGLSLFARFIQPSWRSAWRVACWGIVAMAPVLLWTDYLRSIYRNHAFATVGALTVPLAGLGWKVSTIVRDLKSGGFAPGPLFDACGVIAFVTQIAGIAWLARSTWRERSPWLLIAVPFGVLGLCAHQVVWAGTPGAITRVTLPLALGFNVLARRAPWPWLVLGNLAIVPGVMSFVFRM